MVVADVPTHIWASGLKPGQFATITARMRFDADQVYSSQALFRADKAGRIDLTRHAPISGNYVGVDPMGLIWSVAPNFLGTTDHQTPLPIFKPPDDITFALRLVVDGRTADRAVFTQKFLPPGARRIDVRDSGLVGTLIVPFGIRRPPVVIVLGGSEGGLQGPETRAMLLAGHGFATLALAYYRAEGLPQELVEIPLEYFERAIDWLKSRDDLDADRLGVIGASRGGELALLLGVNFPEIRAVVAHSPPNEVGYGIPRGPRPWELPRRATWSYHGTPLPFYAGALPAPENAPEIIAVERIRGPVMVLAGGDDRLAPSIVMAVQIMHRLKQHHHAYRDSILTYPWAGHAFGLPYLPVVPRLPLGGTAPANAQADRDCWPRVLRFLTQSLSPRVNRMHRRIR
jgi:dienelactone hydrolase